MVVRHPGRWRLALLLCCLMVLVPYSAWGTSAQEHTDTSGIPPVDSPEFASALALFNELPCCISASNVALDPAQLPFHEASRADEVTGGKFYRSFVRKPDAPAGEPIRIMTMVQPLATTYDAQEAFRQHIDTLLSITTTTWIVLDSGESVGEHFVVTGGPNGGFIRVSFQRGPYYLELSEAWDIRGYDYEVLPFTLARARMMAARLDWELAIQAGLDPLVILGFDPRVIVSPVTVGTPVSMFATATPIPTATPRAAPASASEPCFPTIEAVVPAPSMLQARLRNTCQDTLLFSITFVIRAEANGPPLAVSGTSYWKAAPGETHDIPVILSDPANILSRRDRWSANVMMNSSPTEIVSPIVCQAISTTGTCVMTDHWLRGAVRTLARTERGRQLLDIVRRFGVTISRDHTPIGMLGTYSPASRIAYVDIRLDAYSDWERAAALAHELQLAADYASGTRGTTPQACYENEENAYRTQSAIWLELWQGQLPVPQNTAQEALNSVSEMVTNNPPHLTQMVTENYREQCG